MTIEKEVIESIKQDVDLKALVEARGIRLKKNGKGWFGLCPFHDDKSPSLSINPVKMINDNYYFPSATIRIPVLFKRQGGQIWIAGGGQFWVVFSKDKTDVNLSFLNNREME
ncbi:MAG: hypothetical protein DSY90_06970 [Deltaproteobacteria bacterium]|nr:MAG: hypothetical protein DSY90_06970 [Deltaproteobacteria bacterium]